MSEQESSQYATRGDIIRLESKVDKLVDAMSKLVLFEERQSTHALALSDLRKEIEELRKTELETLSKALADLEKKVDMWVNRGMAVWFMVGTAITVYATFFKG